MVKLIMRAALAMMLAAALHLGPAVAATKIVKLSQTNRVGKLEIVNGTSETINISIPFSEIVVGDPETADVNPLTDKTLYVLGRKLGITNIALFDAEKQLVGVIDVTVTHNLAGLRDALKQSLPDSRIKVRSVSGRILLEGIVPSAPAAERAVALAQEFASLEYGKPGAVSNSLQIASNQQVNLEVRFVEVNRTAGKELGVNWNVSGKDAGGITGNNLFGTTANFPGGILTNGNIPLPLGALSGSVPFGTFVANVLGKGLSPDLLINALEQKKLARRLAEPNLTALSGESASFHAGGEYPIPVGQEDGKITIAFKEFGVKLDFTPVVLDDGVINMKVRPEVSEIDPANSIRIADGGVLIPGLSVRKAATSIELRDGQSFAIAGLLQSVNAKTVNQIPWLGNVPILGTLFRSSGFQKRETDLVIIVTARLARPVGNRQHLKTPLDTVASSNDLEFFLLGKTEVSRKQLDQKFHGLYGHIIDLPKVQHGKPNK